MNPAMSCDITWRRRGCELTTSWTGVSSDLPVGQLRLELQAQDLFGLSHGQSPVGQLGLLEALSCTNVPRSSHREETD